MKLLKNILKKFIVEQNIYHPADVDSKDYIHKYSLPFFNRFICVHVIKKTPPDMHNHNRSFISIVLKGGYMEYIRHRGDMTSEPIVKNRRPGSIIYRHHSDFHQVAPYKTTYTLYIFGPKVRNDIDWLSNGVVTKEARHWIKKGYTKEFLKKMYEKQGKWNRLK